LPTGWLARRFGESLLVVDDGVRHRLVPLGIASMGMLGRAPAGLRRRADVSDHPRAAAVDYPPAKRGQAIALLAMVTVVAPIAGPDPGGWITDNHSWE
jgi:DHA2 family multidrug resistance protein